MKKLPYLFIAVLLLGIASCGEDDEPAASGGEIVGTWKSTHLKNENCTDSNENFDLPDTSGMFELSLTADGTFSITLSQGGNAVTTTGTYTVTGDQIESCTDGTPQECDSTTFTVDGDTLTIITQDDDCLNTITYARQ